MRLDVGNDFAQFFKTTSTRTFHEDFAELERMNKVQFRKYKAAEENGGLSAREFVPESLSPQTART